MSFYDELGVRRMINGNTTLTAWGGSIMPPPKLQAMSEAAVAFVDIHDLLFRQP